MCSFGIGTCVREQGLLLVPVGAHVLHVRMHLYSTHTRAHTHTRTRTHTRTCTHGHTHTHTHVVQEEDRIIRREAVFLKEKVGARDVTPVSMCNIAFYRQTLYHVLHFMLCTLFVYHMVILRGV